MLVIDMHCDSLLNVSSQRGLVNKYNVPCENQYLQFFAAFVPKHEFCDADARRRAVGLMDAYLAEVKRLGIVNVSNCRDLVFASTVEKPAGMFTVEGGAGLYADSRELKTLYQMGLRVMGLVWDSNHLACSAWDADDYGLTDEGRRMVRTLSEFGIVVDVSHMSDNAFYQTLECTAYPVIATHSNFREVCSSPRNLTLDMAERIKARGGVIGLNLYPEFLKNGGAADLNDVLRHVDYALEKLGEDTLAFGFDIDGTDGQYPLGLDESSSIHDRVVELLVKQYGDRVAEKIAGLNALNFLKENI